MALKSFAVAIAAVLLAAGVAQAATAQGTTFGRAMNRAFAKGGQTIRDAEHKAARFHAPAKSKPAHAVSPRTTRHSGKGRAMQRHLDSGDPLAGTDATTCHQANGATIHVSGGYTPAPGDTGACQ